KRQIVAHGGLNRTILCHILEIPLHTLLRLEQDYGCVNHLRTRDNDWRVVSVNYTPK
ncbi:MAG: histidine phosphatase family protein, partial [Desulfovibrionales bacterium]|nr:histidine phosphatase family protein [Desulfovibrionales bacterium]